MNWSGPLRSLGAIHRLAALVVALVWGLAPILAVFHSHSSGEAHRYCAEHGVLEDVADEGDPAPASESDGTVVGQVEAARSHRGCAFGTFCRFGQLPSQLVVETGRILEATLVLLPVARVPAPSVAVIVVAPKTSPPV